MGPELVNTPHSSKRFKIILGISIALLVIGGLVLYARKNNVPGISNIVNSGKDTTTPEQTFPAINGMPVTERIAHIRPIGVMIENSPEARPQSGLAEADIVYETLAEGGITRFLALYQTRDAENIGPVRSARDYYAQIADEWGVLYAHVGGSDEVLAQLSAGVYKNISDANQFSYGAYFHRITARVAPHNVYTSIEKLRDIIADKKFKTTATYTPWNFKADNDTLGGTILNAETITIKFSTGLFDAKYVYDAGTKKYNRFLSGTPHLDAETKQQLTADTVIVQYVSIAATPGDEKARVDIGLTGQGKAFIFHDGIVTEGQWKKAKGGRTIYYTQAGEELTLAPGKIWIALTSPGTMTYKAAVANTAPAR